MSKPKISFVIPAKNEEDSIITLYGEILTALKGSGNSFEIIFIDDGSNDRTFERIQKIIKRDKRVKVIQHRGNFGKSIALQNGFDLAKGNLIFTLDADLQDNPKEIPKFLDKINAGFDMVVGWKKARHDPKFSKVIPSRIINFMSKYLTGVPIHDNNCGFKVYRKSVIENINLYGELYRFIPIIAHKQNFKVGEVVIDHRVRQFGKTKYGWGRGIKGILDLLTVIFLTGFIGRPGHFFGSLGIAGFLGGFVVGIYITYLRITTGNIQGRHPLLFLGMLLMIIGVQLISIGLLAEMIIYSRKKTDYNWTIKKILPRLHDKT